MSANGSDLAPFFYPKGVAVIGASRDSAKLSHGILLNLLHPDYGFPGPVYPINPGADTILGTKCYPNVSMIPGDVDLAIIALPAKQVPAALDACGKRGIQAAVIISGGFAEAGVEGTARQEQIIEIARCHGMRLIGPNCIGIIDTHVPLNMTFVRDMPPKGNIAFLSQSGALCGGVIDWVIGRGIGFSRLVSIGNEADITESDLLPFLANDDATHVITMYLEDIRGGQDFLPALTQAAAKKPVLVIKTGRTEGGQAAAASHTGALVKSHQAFQAACRKAGALELASIKEMFNAALALAYQPLPGSNRIAILTNAGGPAALAADALQAAGLCLARTGSNAIELLRTFLPSEAPVQGPVDILGSGDVEEYRRALSVLLSDEAADGVVAILVPHSLTKTEEYVKAVAETVQASRVKKPIIMNLMGEASLGQGLSLAHQYRLPAFTFPDEAVSAIGILANQYRIQMRSSIQTTKPLAINSSLAGEMILSAMANKQASLDPLDSAAILAAYGVAVAPSKLAANSEEAAQVSEQVGYPCALKIVSPDILHKSDIGGVLLNIHTAAEARTGYEAILSRARQIHPQARVRGVLVQPMVSGGLEVIVGINKDPTFGPVVMFGMGGIFVETIQEVSFRLAPLDRGEAEEMIAEVRGAKLLDGLRNSPPLDRRALIQTLLSVSRLASDFPQIAELDINPLLVLPDGHGVAALDARIILTLA